jgi:malic enzyme
MLMAAAHSIAELAPEEDLVPDALDPAVHAAVAEAVRAAVLADRNR